MSWRKRVLSEVDAIADEIREVSRFISAHPEIGLEERQAAAFLRAKLQAHGFRVERPMASLPTAFRASLPGRRRSPAIGFCAEYDALPGMGHGCGHNLIAASAFGAAVALAPVVRALGGSVWLFGTPAEENDGSKIRMLGRGVLDPADVILQMHPEGMYLVNTTALALDALTFRFRGKAAHAASTPHEGRNALDAVVQLFNGISALRQQLRPEVRIHGIITRGGTHPNIIPDLGEAKLYVRATERDLLDGVTQKVKRCARAAALATGCRLEVETFERPTDHLTNNPILAQLLQRNLESLGVRIIDERDEFPGSTDFGNVSQRIPSVYFYAATAPRGAVLHTAEFARLSVTPRAHEQTLTAVKAMALTGLDLLTSRSLLDDIRRAGPRRRARLRSRPPPRRNRRSGPRTRSQPRAPRR